LEKDLGPVYIILYTRDDDDDDDDDDDAV